MEMLRKSLHEGREVLDSRSIPASLPTLVWVPDSISDTRKAYCFLDITTTKQSQISDVS